MACVNPDGTLTASAAAILQAVQTPGTPQQVAETTGLPLFRVRSGLREMVDAQLVIEREGYYRATPAGAGKAP